MKKKVFSLMMTLLLAFMGVAKAEVVEIGDGGTTTNSYLPNYEFYNYSLTQQIYTAAEIGTAGTINSIAFFYTGTATRTLDIYMVNTTVGSFSSNNDWITVTTADKVYSGSVTYTANAWNTLVLDTPFAYDGVSNLAVIVDDNTGSYVSSVGAYVFDATGMSLRIYSDGTNYDPLAPTMGSGAVLNVKNQIQLNITPGGGGGGQSGEITLHDGTTTNSYVPVYGFYVDAYNKDEMVYPASELSAFAGGTINSLKFYASNANVSWGSANFQVFLTEVGSTTISAFNGPGTVVYEGALSIVNNEMMITFSTPYQYNGGNLLVGVYNTTTGSYSSCSWYGETVDGASIHGYSYSDLSSVSPTQRNFLPKVTIAYTTGGGSGVSEQLFAMQNGEDVETIVVGTRPNGYWMEPFTFQLRNDGPATTVSVIDFTPTDYFTVVAPELPVSMSHDEIIDVQLNTGEGTATEWQMAVLYGTGRTARVWDIVAEPYDPATPDVWELACEEATSFPFVEWPATAHNTTLHNDYTLPFPEIPEGNDAVYKLVFDNDMILNAEVTTGADGKVAIYREGFEGEGGPMATNNYVGPTIGGGAAGAPFEAQIGEGTTTSTYFPFHTLWNYSLGENLFLASELTEAGVTTAPMTSLSWYVSSTTCTTPQNGINIWMANVSDEALTATSHITAGMTLVYTGTNVLPVAGQWNEFVFNEGNFAWDGHSNVLIVCQRLNGSWQGSVSWQTHNPGFTAMAYDYDDYEVYNCQTTAYSMYTSATNRANIIMKGGGRGRNRDVVLEEGFEDGVMPMDWHSEGDNAWIVGTGDYSTGTGANTGSYNAKITHNYSGDVTYLVTPAMDLSGASEAALSFAYVNRSWAGDIDELGVYYRVNGGAWNELFYTTDAHATWTENTIALAGLADNYEIGFRMYDDYGYGIGLDDVVVTATMNGGNNGGNTNFSYGPVITDMPVEAGTYYLVASSTDADFEVTINAEDMPCPEVDDFAFNPTPADDADGIEPGSVTLRWNIPAYATGWRLVFGTTYHPEVGHPQTIIYPEDGSFSTTLANSYTVRNLWNNTNYFWRVEFNNGGACPDGVSSPVWGFTTHLNIPQNLTAVDYTVFDDETIVLNWNAVQDRTYRTYNVYRDGELIGNTTMNDINATTFTDGPLAYNMAGYVYHVTAVYDEGESDPSDPVTVKVSGYGDVNGHVYEQDGETGIAGATVTMVGTDEFNVSHTYNFQTNSQGYYSGHIYAGSYNGSAAKEGYQTINEPVQGNPIAINYNETTTPIDYMLDEEFVPVCTVIAEYYPDSLDPESPYVKVYWGCGLPGEEIIEPFETGDFSLFPWNINGSYPWEVTTTHPYEGNYCMRSTNYNVASSTSSIDVTVNIPADGIMSFYGYISSESNWDYGYFYIDNVQKGSYTGAGNAWGEKKFDITAGDHNFKWTYTKDGSVNSNEDRFYVDYITFFKRPEPAQPGWHTYCESEFNNAVGSNLTTTPSWAYEYPAAFLHTNYAGWNITKVSLFSDNMYSAVGGNYTCRIYVGGSQPAAGTMVSELTVDVPSNQNAWVDWDLTTPVNVTGNDPIYVVWTANTTVSSWPAGCCGDLNDLGTWWDGGNGWEHLTYGTWTMRHWFTNRAGRSVALSTASNVAESTLNSNLRTFVKGENSVNAICANPNAVKGAALENGNTRRFSHYRVYRTDCYNDGPYTTGNTELLACDLTDTIYIDTYWPDVLPGIYKWGVGVVYVGNRGEEYESPITWATLSAKGNRAELTYDFDDNTMQNWTSIDADGDGNGWVSSSNPGIYHNSGVNLSGTGHNSSEAYVISGSYANQTGQVLYPDNYLVSPQIALGGSITFYACAQDASYAAEHFGVAVSTTGNTSASSFTTIQEWTMTAKGASDVRTVGRDGNNRVQGNWYQYTVDLSSYSGMGYVAIRHFNCHDEFILNVDDITIVEGAGGGGGGGGVNPIQEPRESEIVWSNCLDKDMYLTDVDVTVLLNSADSPEGAVVKFENYNEYEQQAYPIADITMDETGYYPFVTFRRGAYKVTVMKEGYETINDSINLIDYPNNLVNELHLRYVMTEILYGVENVYVSRTGWAMWDDSHNNPGGGGGGGQGGSGDTFTEDFENGLSNWTIVDADGDGHNWYHSSQSMTYSCYDYTGWGHNSSDGFAVSQSYTDCTYDSYDPNNFLITNQKYSITSSSVLNFWADYGNDSYPDHFGVAVATVNNPTPADFTMVWEGNAKSGNAGKSQIRYNGERYQNWRSHSVSLSAYAGQDVYIAFRHFNSYDEYEIYIDDVELTTGGKSADEMQHFEYYKVLCTSIDGVPIYNHNTVYPFCQLSTNEPYMAPLVEGDHYLIKVASVYSTGVSPWSEPVEWEYEPCDHWGPVDEVTVDPTNQGNHIQWVFENGFNPYGGGGGGGGGQASFEWYYYDDGVNVDAIGTGGGQFWWAVMFPAGTYEGHQLTKVSAYDYEAMTGTASIYQGGSNAPAGSAIGQTSVTLTGSNQFVEFEFASAVTVDPTQNLWVVFYNASGAGWPAAVSANTGDPNGRWVSLDGTTWEDLAGYGLDYTFQLRAYIGDGAKSNVYGAPTMVSGMISNDVYAANITEIENFDERVIYLYNLVNDDRFNVINGEENGVFIVSLDNAYEGNLSEMMKEFNAVNAKNFAMMDKEEASATALNYKAQLPFEMAHSLMMDLYVKSRENALCADAYPFCTDNGMYEFPAGVNAGSGEAGPDYSCLYTTPNPAWYYMRIGNPGDINIYMYSTPSVDIDFCCWGPFDDPTTPCPNGLTSDKVVSCSYSANPTENCIIPSSAQTGEYYILIITNYSNQPCNINFSKVSGSGDTDCGILPPVDIIGFLITEDGEYLAFAGPTDRDYLHEGEFGEHEYCVRPIYPGEMTLPSNNFGWSMGCPVCQEPGTIITCEPGAPIHGEAIGATDQVKVWWGVENPGPGCEGDEFTVDFESGMPTGWTTIDADGDGNNWTLGSVAMGAGYGHNGSSDLILSKSYDNNSGALTPDNWLVSPAVTLCENSTFSFFACAQDNAWASEHFGVAVSEDGGNTFTMIQEWTMTAKGEPYAGPRGMRDQGNWYQYTVNLGDYAGDGRKVAIRHFNCTDWFYLDVDDIELSAGAKATRDGIVKYNVYRSTENANYTLIGEVAAVAGQTYYEYIDTPASAGSYYYQVTAVYADCESEPAAAFDNPSVNYVVVGVTGIGENGGTAIYPNPTSGNVTIEAVGMQHITVVSTLGQVVFDADVEGNHYILNMSQFVAGMYTVRVATENGVSVNRITVVR